MGKNFTVYGYKNSNSQKYADTNGLNFIELDNVYINGDVDLNGVVNIADATLIQKACAGMVKLNDIQNLNADLNLDGIVNVADATLIQKKIAGIK